ncbi:MAG: DUF454 family protein [Pseudomonadales bacterium]|nr:DUF454 family protein [Pseudomonadales bacterium]
MDNEVNDKMNFPATHATTVKPHTRAMYVALAVLFLMVGLIGILIPVIPGLIFLGLALLMLGKVSRRVRVWTESKPMLKKLARQLDRMAAVDFPTRLKASGLLMLQSLMSAAAVVVTTGSGALRLLKRRRRPDR